jgi:cytochrome c-type biogenesis protein
MEFLLVSFLAGVLTVLAPCVISLLPVILGGTLGQKNPWRPLVIAGSLGVSVILFTVLLKFFGTFFGASEDVLKWISVSLIFVFGLTMVFPNTWNKIAFKLKLYKSEGLLQKSHEKGGLWGAVLLGASLGPVFTTCSPTYAIILAVVLPQSFTIALFNLIAYALGLMVFLLAIGYGGQALTKKFRWAANPGGWFKKVLGGLLILTSLAIMTGADKKVEAWIIEQGYLGPIGIEGKLLDGVDTDF